MQERNFRILIFFQYLIVAIKKNYTLKTDNIDK
jgi:hypothetical protein